MGNCEDIKNRLRKVLIAKSMSVPRIAGGVGVKRSTLYAQINGMAMLSADTLRLFLDKFPDLSAEWLLRGEGPMLKSGGDD